MRRNTKLLLSLAFLCSISFLTFKVFSALNGKNKIEESIAVVPKFNFKTLNREIFSNENLKKGISTVFIHFNSECDICQIEAMKLEKNIDEFKKVQILYISSETSNKIGAFSDNFGLNKFENITFLIDEKEQFTEWIKSSQTPYILAYDKNNNLVFQHIGTVNITKLVKALGNGY